MSDNEQAGKKGFWRTFGGVTACFLLILLALFLFASSQVLADLIFFFFGLSYKTNEGLYIITYVLIAVPLLLIYLKIRSYKREPLLRNSKMDVSRFCLAVVIALGMLGLVTVYMIVADKISESFAPMEEAMEQYQDSVDRYSGVEKDAVPFWDVLIEAFALTFLVPLAEELLFRGIVLGELARKFGNIWAIILSSAIFGIMHGLSIHIGYALICGFFLGFVYVYTDSIKSSYILHAVFNFFGSAFITLFEHDKLAPFQGVFDAVGNVVSILEIALIIPSIVAVIFLIKLSKEGKLGGDHEPS